MKIKLMILGLGLMSSLQAVECTKNYNKAGCNEVSFNLGSEMSLEQYRVVYDDDQDGVSNTIDKCLNTPLNTLVDNQGCSKVVKKEEKVIQAVDETVKETKVVEVMTLNVHFDFSKYNLLAKYKSEVSEFADFLTKNPSYNAEIVGHTDSSGLYTKNLLLSQSRAQTILEALVDLGIDKSRLTSRGVGSSESIATNTTKEGRAQNRRIEVTLTKEGN